MGRTTDYTVLENVQKLSEIDPELEEFLKINPPQPAATGDVDWPTFRAERRRSEKEYAESIVALNNDVKMYTEMIPMRDGHMNELLILAPNTPPPEGSPLCCLFYGGGFVGGNMYQLAPLAWAYVSLLGATIVLPSYRLAPENPFPASANDAWDTLLWVAANAAELGSDPSLGFILGGNSAGGSLSAVIAQMAIHAGLTPCLTGLMLSIPAVLDVAIVPETERHLYIAREQNANVVGFNKASLDAVRQAWKPDLFSPLFSPFNAENPHKGMPPTYIQVCGLDPLRDDGLIYERVLRQHGVPTELDVYPGVPHGHVGTYPFLQSSKKFLLDTVLALGRLLGKNVDAEVALKTMVPRAPR